MKATTSPTLNKFLSIARLMEYKLPGKPGDKHVIGISSGADSSVLGMILCLLFPETDFILLHTDTQEEINGTGTALEEIESFIGRKVNRISDPDGLYGLVERYNGFLPSSLSRYCTRVLKVELSQNYIDALRGNDDIQVHNYAGLRADEPGRSGLDSSMPWLLTHFPMRDLGMKREDVFGIMSETVGVPSFYREKSRSGCAICPMMRASEYLAVLETHTDQFVKAEQYEKLNDLDKARFAIEGTDISPTHMPYPIPAFVDARYQGTVKGMDFDAANLGRKKKTLTIDFFSEQKTHLFVAVEYLVDGLMGMFDPQSPGIHHSRIIGWGTDKTGLKTKINYHYESRLNTAEVFDLTQDALKKQYKVAVFSVEVNASCVDLEGISKGSYVWNMEVPFAKLRKTINSLKRTMMYLGCLQELRWYEDAQEGTWQAAQFETALGRAKRLKAEKVSPGRLLQVYSYEPCIPTRKEKEDSTVPAPCFVCSK